MESQIEIRFGKSTSSRYSRALQIAKTLPNFFPISEENNFNTIKTDTAELLNNFETFDSLISYISDWKSTEILFNGEQVSPFHFIYKYREIIDCSKMQAVSAAKDIYCHDDHKRKGWGCRHLTNIKRHLEQRYSHHHYKYWYWFGDFENDYKEWKINKSLLKEALLKEVLENKIDCCAIFSFDKLDKKIKELPDKIVLTDNDSWEIEYEKDFYGDLIENKPIGIKNRESEETENSSILLDALGLDNDDDVAPPTTRNIPKLAFAEIGGIDDIIEQIREVIELPLKKPELFKYLGIKPHKGILLYGPPGNGKTMIAQAIANEVKAHFIPISGPELYSEWLGKSEENLRNIFNEAKKYQPTIIFFDEIDSIAQKRSGDESVRHDSRFVNQLLTLMDGMETYENVSVVASTNRPELLDLALLRPGRFDYKIEIKKPNHDGCLKIITIATTNMPMEDVPLKEFSQKLLGLSGAEIAFVAKEAAYNSLRRNYDLKSIITSTMDVPLNEEDMFITIADMERALETVKRKDYEKE